MDEAGEIKRLLEKNLAVSQEALSIARSLQKAHKMARFLKTAKWILIIALSLGIYYYIQPFVQTFWQSLENIKNDFGSAKNTVQSLNSSSGIWERINSFLDDKQQ